MAAAEDAVPERWWRLLHEYRAYTATDPVARAKLADAERRCREILARYIDGALAAIGLAAVATDRARRAEHGVDRRPPGGPRGRPGLDDPGSGTPIVVRALIATSTPVEQA